MKNVISIVLLTTMAFSTSSFAGGSKGSDPLKSNGVIVFDGGSKGSDPSDSDFDTGTVIVSDGGSKGSDPERGGSKGSDPAHKVITMDSGYPTLSALLSKYFSF